MVKRCPDPKYTYLVISIYVEEHELELWEALVNQDKAALSSTVYQMVLREMPALKASALKSLSLQAQKSRSRRLYLLTLPEFKAVAGFLRANMRRPALRAHLKSLLLYGESQLAPTEPPPLVPTTKKGKARSPRELFSDPNKLVQTMLKELRLPEEKRVFAWGEIPPDDYPDNIRDIGLFAFLREYWEKEGGHARRIHSRQNAPGQRNGKAVQGD